MAGSPDQSHSSPYPAYPPSSQPYRQDAPPTYDAADIPPPPPVHRSPVGGYGSTNYSDFSPPEITPEADNLGESAAGGGITGIAAGVANTNERESGVQALRDLNSWGRNGSGTAAGPRGTPPTATPFADDYRYDQSMSPPRPIQPTYVPLGSGAMHTPSNMSSSNSESESLYSDNPYNRYSSSNLQLAPQLGAINPQYADEDDDWGMGPQPQRTVTQKRRSKIIPFVGSRDGSQETVQAIPLAASAAVGAGAGTAAYAAAPDASGNYNAVPGGSASQGSAREPIAEKTAWIEADHTSRKKKTWILGTVIVLVCLGAILGGILGSTIHKGGSSNNSNTKSVVQDNKVQLTAASDEIKELMNNKDLHKVFPGIDYTPLNTQYPECMHHKPSQNNITRDVAVLSQLTNAVRLYGTDCNQTEMVLTAIDRLDLPDMKVWLGVWLGTNETTNSRQVKQMYNILDNYDAKRFKGIIIGNEVLYREDLTETELLSVITDVKSELKKKSIDLPIATSDLGDNWTAEMARKENVDIVMSNVHPFFAGVEAKVATAWTWNFWQTHDVVLTANDPSVRQIVAEVGWPSAGGNSCGMATCTSDDEGSVASVENMNVFMEDWVCPSMKNGTEYFW